MRGDETPAGLAWSSQLAKGRFTMSHPHVHIRGHLGAVTVLEHHHKTVRRERAAYVGNLVDPTRPLSGSTPSRVQSPEDSAKHRLKLS